MRTFELLGYNIYLIENVEDSERLRASTISKIAFLAFDTETNTKINWAKKNENLIDIKHDMPFLLQFGYGNKIYVADFRNKSKEYVNSVLLLYDKFVKNSVFVLAHNIKFDINMLMNIGYTFTTDNLCDTQTIARLSLEAKSEREGGYSMQLKPLASRILGSMYADLGHQIDEALSKIWLNKVKVLATSLKRYGIKKHQIENTLKDVTGTLDEYPLEVQHIFSTWQYNSYVSYADVDPELLYRYGAADVILCLELNKRLLPVVNDRNQMPILKREMKLIMPLVHMERTGYTVDKNYIIKCKQALIFEINTITQKNVDIIGEDISPNQHAMIKSKILEKFNYTLNSTSSPEMKIIISKDKDMPEPVKEYLENVMYLRTLRKWVSTYINPMLYKLNNSGDTKVYTQYNPNGAVSGRFTSNFQQFPKDAIYSKLGNFELFHPRRMFVCDKDYPEMAYIDYSQVELRLQAEYTYRCTHGYGDINMLRAYMPFKCHKGEDGKWYHDEDNQEWKGIDLHTQSTLTAFPDLDIHSEEFKHMRYVGKRVNFALIYGSSLANIQQVVADADPEVVAKLYRGFHERFKDVRTYGNYVANMWSKNGGYVTNLLGRRYYMSESKDVYKLNNYLIQGSAADIIKMCIIRVDDMLKKNGYKSKLQGCIHDELCVCVAEGEHDVVYKIKNIMETTVKTFVPLVADIDLTTTTWADKKEEEE